MVGVPEFDQERVQGGLYPTQIWQHYMNNAHAFLPGNDWPAAPAPARAPQRLFLPGNECIYVITDYVTGRPAGLRQPSGRPNPESPPTTMPTAPPVPAPVGPPPTLPPQPVYSRVDSGTTIPPNVLDPRAPINTVPLDYRVAAC
jgi:penicillin-binding protein 1A